MSRYLSHRHAGLARLLLCAAVGAAAFGALPGCGGEDASDSIKQARIDLETLASSRGAPVSTKGRQVSYEQVIKSLDKAASSSRTGQAAAAKLIRSRAKVRLADIKAAQAADIERRTLDRIVSIRAAHDRWLSLNAGAAALEAFDPKPALAELDKQIADKDNDINAALADKAKAEGLIADLTSKASAATAKGKAEHDEEAKLRQSAVDKSETQRADLIKAAAERRRAGDGFDKEAANLGAEIAKEQPNLAAITRRIERLQQQRKLLEDGKKQVTDSVEVNKQQAGKSRETAAAVAADLVKWTTELKELRAGLTDPNEHAERFYSEAYNEASKAGSGQQRASMALATASCKQALGDALLVRARGLDAYASLLEMLAQTQPPIPGASFANDAATARKDATETLAKAKEAFTEAEQAYSGAGASSEVKGRVEYIARTLHLIATGKAPAAEPAAAPGEAPEAKDGAAQAPAAPPAEPSAGAEAEIRAMLKQMATDVEAGSVDSMMAYMSFQDEKDRAQMGTVMGVFKKMKELDSACTAAFGSDLKTILSKSSNPALKAMGAASMSDSMIADFKGKADKAEIKVVSDTEAEVTDPDKPEKPAKVIRNAEGKWLLVVEPSGAEAGAMVQVFSKVGDVYDTITQNIKSGNYGSDADKMLADLQAEIMKAAAPPPPK